ncbi:CyP450 monooxygenase [Trametes coccinea BRFM310]|uniref:CyP450 monooxygenase n=1 Tax=Trametes coccinea (strain BRFM310) TaxID=1353009 RepID=A0A1Y2J1T2_TRAC3|nr:CyP450 monooxygenase [Trametes coccinea BRFM310]
MIAGMTSPIPLAITLAILALSLTYVRSRMKWRIRTRGLPFPPGPRPLPLIGNILDLPRIKPWRKYTEWCAQYGGLVYLQAPGISLAIINDAEMAVELLDKHSAKTSDRPQLPILKLSGQDLNFCFFPYGERWRRHRRQFWQRFHRSAISQYLKEQRTGVHRLLGRLLDSPAHLKSNIGLSFQGTMLKIVYGFDVVHENDKRLSIASAALDALVQSTPGHFAVEMFPSLRYIPAWFPGAGFQHTLAHSKAATLRLKHELFAAAKDIADRAGSNSCLATDLLARAERNEGSASTATDETLAQEVCLVTVEGSADTTSWTLEGFFLAMSLYPDVQKKAQKELDAVIGPNRLPDHDDSDSLVYVNAVLKECLRWHVTAPVALPHCAMADIEIRGYFIPKGTTITVNTWQMLHDPEVYDQPEEFRPERFIKDGKLDSDVKDPEAIAFGFGRRICPGRHFALASLFINIASLLHVFDITPPLDENGQPIRVNRPEDCRCNIKPRSAAAEALIREAQRAADAAGGEN